MPELEVGRIDRAHGLNGDVIVTLTTDRTAERLAVGSVLQTDRGPLIVRTARPYQQRWLVTFEGVHDRTTAETWRGQVLRAEPLADPEALWVHELIGAEVRTPDGRGWGRVEAVQANPAHDLLELTDGTLVPVVFVTDAGGLPDVVVVDPPEGLLGGGEDE